MFIDEHALDYSSPPLYDEYDDDLFEFESETDDAYNDPFDSKGEKIKESKLLIDELDLPRSSDFLPSPKYDSFLDFSEVDALSSTNNEDKDFDPPLYELPFYKEVPWSETQLSFSSKNEEKVFKPGILTSKGVHCSLLPEISHRGPKVFKVIKILESPMKILPCSYGEDIRILDVPSGSESRLHMLNKENYVPWSSHLLRYAKSRPNGKLIHNSILNGSYVRKMIPEPGDANRDISVTKTFHLQTDDELPDKKLKKIEADDQAIQTILLGLPEDIYVAVDSCETAQEIWLRPKVTKPKKVGTRESLATPKPRKSRLLLRWSPTGRLFNQEGKIVDSSKSNSHSDCVNGGNLKLLINFVWKFMGTVRFGNDHVAAILGFGDLQWGNILIARVYFVEGLGHNLFSAGQFYDSDLEVAFRRNACFVRNLEGVDLLKGDPSSTKSWLWHQRLSHLNPFDTINDLARNDLVSGLPKFKYHKEHLCPSCEQGKSKRASHLPKPVPNLRQILHLLHMDLYGPMRIASINGKRKTPYELINGRKPDILFLHVFNALCYPKNDREDTGKLGAKGDIGFFI
nr:retrovirus-related Pol polyprotein from transposon TNT 1-94 [Tanacetum cinerariifolium]